MTKCDILALFNVFQISPLNLFENGFATWLYYTTNFFFSSIKAKQFKTITRKLMTVNINSSLSEKYLM